MDLNAAAHVLPPREGSIGVTSVAAGAATAAIEIANKGQYVSIAVDNGAGVEPAGVYLTSKLGADPTAPNPTATSGGGRTMWLTPPELRALVFSPGEKIKLYIPGAGTYYVRQYPSGPG
jgi:hypothetical protein